MELYDSYITNIENLLKGKPCKRFPFNGAETWPTENRGSLILIKDSAYELGGGSCNSVGLTAVSSDADIVSETVVYGNDVADIKSDCDFAKIVLLKIKDFTSDEQTIFNVVKELEYAKYKINLQGFMSRASAINHREQVRVAETAVRQGLSFEKIGNTLINAYLLQENVVAAKIIFVTAPDFNFDTLNFTAEKVSTVTKALNHILDNVIIDCNNCNLKPVCDEVEGMRELHIKMSK